MGLSEDDAARYAELMNRLEKKDNGEEVEPLTEDDISFVRYITLPLSVKLPREIDAIVRSLPNSSEKLMQWIIEGMEREGLI
ncbi:MAG TPA: hypothetical protein DDW76_07390 [Cyanobacteria bacterium UBA11369]|nr:hypothetical protein [Cyanobacteria bacterium UBA11369]